MLTKNILQTIIYYDILNFPLTSFEVWKYLIGTRNKESGTENISLGDVVETLDSEELKNHIEEYRGFYFLPGRKDLVARRIQNDKNSIGKYKIAERVAWWLRFVPFVRMTAATGTVAMKNCEKESDIDFFVVLEKGRIFTGRLAATLLVHLLGRRRYGNRIKNRICLNHFRTTRSLEIERKDSFAPNEYSFLYPLFGFDVYEEFAEANINWIRKIKPDFSYDQLKPAKYYVEHGKTSRFIQKTIEDLINFLGGDRIESWLKRKQIAHIKRNPLTYKKGAYIKYNDDNLVFLPEPQGVGLEEKIQERIENIHEPPF